MDECGSDQNAGAEVLGVEDDTVGASAAGVAGQQRKSASCENRTVSDKAEVGSTVIEAVLGAYILCSEPGSGSMRRRV